MKYFLHFFLVLVLFSTPKAVTAQADKLPSGVWKNQGGSLATIIVEKSGTENVGIVSGAYKNGETKKFPCAKGEYPIKGVYLYNTGLISFSVAWDNGIKNCGTVTSWTGYIENIITTTIRHGAASIA